MDTAEIDTLLTAKAAELRVETGKRRTHPEVVEMLWLEIDGLLEQRKTQQ